MTGFIVPQLVENKRMKNRLPACGGEGHVEMVFFRIGMLATLVPTAVPIDKKQGIFGHEISGSCQEVGPFERAGAWSCFGTGQIRGKPIVCKRCQGLFR